MWGSTDAKLHLLPRPWMETMILPLELSDRLSPELYDRIIDHLHFFKHSLSTCSIVCQSWLPASRYHLFLDVNLSPDLVHFIDSSPHAMETITPYIRNVTLGGAWLSEQRSEFDNVISLLLMLESVRGLSLETWSWDFLSITSQDLLLKSEGTFFSNITDINLKYIRFPSFSLLIKFIGGFPMLGTLSLYNVTWNSDNECHSPQMYSHRPLRLMKLYVRSCFVEPVLSWLFRHDFVQHTPTPPVRVLALPEILPGELEIVGHVLGVLGSNLQHVELGFLSVNLDDSANHGSVFHRFVFTSLMFIVAFIGFPDLVDLSRNTNLRRIYVHQLTLYHFPFDAPLSSLMGNSRSLRPYYWLIPMLSRLLSSHLEELVFVMWLSAESQLELIDWTAMTELLLSNPFSSLQRVSFEVTGIDRDREQVKAWLMTRLGQWIAPEATLEVRFIDGC